MFFCKLLLLFALIQVEFAKALHLGDTDEKSVVQHRDGDILIGGMVEVHYNGMIRDYGIEIIEVVNMIINQVNNDSTILPGVTLGTMIIDTKRQDTYALHEIVTEFLPIFTGGNETCKKSSKDTKVLFAGIFGPTSSDVSIETAKLLQAFSIPQISYWATSPELSNKNAFPYFFRTMPSDSHQAKAIVDFIHKKGWDYVSVIYEDSLYGLRAISAIKDAANENNICIAVEYKAKASMDVKETHEIINKLKKKETARAVILFVMHESARAIMQAAAADRDCAEKFLWIATEAWTGLLPETNDDISSYETELDGVIGFSPASAPIQGFKEYFTGITLKSRQKTMENPWFGEYIGKKNNCSLQNKDAFTRTCATNEHIEPSSYLEFIYTEKVANAILAFVHAINQIHKAVCRGKPGICDKLKGTSGTNGLAELTYSQLKSITFRGINGKEFKFDKNQDVEPLYDISVYKKNLVVLPGEELTKWRKIGRIGKNGLDLTEAVTKINRSYCSEECGARSLRIPGDSTCCWSCQPCDSDHEYIENGTECKTCSIGYRVNANYTGCEATVEIVRYEQPYSIAAIAFGSFGTILTIAVFAIYVKYRNTAIAKASGRELSFVVLFGVMLSFLNCWSTMIAPSPVSCGVSRIILTIGPTIMYSALLAKTARVVIIFRNKLLSPKIQLLLHSEALLVITAAIVLIEVFLVVIWFVTSPPQPMALYDEIRDRIVITCVDLITLSILIGLIYPFLLILVCTITAAVNRNIPTNFNEAKLIGFTMYTTCVIWLAFIPIFTTSATQFGFKLMTVSICVSLSALTVLVCLFGPHCYTMLFNPERNTWKSVFPNKATTSSPAHRINSIEMRSPSHNHTIVVEN